MFHTSFTEPRSILSKVLSNFCKLHGVGTYIISTYIICIMCIIIMPPSNSATSYVIADETNYIISNLDKNHFTMGIFIGYKKAISMVYVSCPVTF